MPTTQAFLFDNFILILLIYSLYQDKNLIDFVNNKNLNKFYFNNQNHAHHNLF